MQQSQFSAHQVWEDFLLRYRQVNIFIDSNLGGKMKEIMKLGEL